MIFQQPSLSIFLSFSEHSRDIFHETKQGEQSNHLQFISPPGCAYYTQSSHYTRDPVSMYQLTHYWKTLCLISPHNLFTHIFSLLKATFVGDRKSSEDRAIAPSVFHAHMMHCHLTALIFSDCFGAIWHNPQHATCTALPWTIVFPYFCLSNRHCI